MQVETKQMKFKIFAAVFLGSLVVGCGTAPVAEGEPAAADEAAMTDRFESEQTQSERRAAEQAEFERQAAEEAEAERLAAQREAERRAAEEAEAERLAAQREAERRAAEQAEAERIAAEREAERRAAGQAEAERLAAEREAERRAAEEAERVAEQERREAEEAEAERRAPERQASADRAAAQADAVPADDIPGIIPRTSENIARLGNDLTPMGSVRAGNEDGTIPAWDGGLTRDDWPAGFQPGDRHPNPFSDDEPLFVIDGDNYQEYSDRLSAGQIATFERFPDTYYMKVYPTRRSTSFPERIYEMTKRNAESGRLIGNGEGVTDVAEGFPFPLAQNAYELMWNHKLKYKGIGGTRYNNQVVPTTRGSFQLIRLREELLGLYYREGMTIEDTNNILLYFFQEVESPARLAGNILLVHETLNQIENPRQAWIYNPGQRRVRRAPNVAYDNPGTASDGLRTNDMTDMFNGAMDRFNWEVVEKREMFIPYNSYDAHSGDISADDLVRPGHLNPEYMRYELHRVWVIEATLREGTRHINPRRTFYLDEDSYQIALIDHYDQRGNLWRASEAHTINYYEVPTYWSSIETHMDLQSGRYIANGIDNQDPVNTFNVELSPSNYTPQALRTRGRR